MKLAVFASGGGSNLQAILDAIEGGMLDAEVVLVVADRPEAGALGRAASASVASAVVRPSEFVGTGAFDHALRQLLSDYGVDFIALAGYLKHVPAGVVEAFRHKILNVHPALLPAFGGKGLYGRRVHEAVIAHGVRWSGATVHLVDEEYDTGPIVLQEPVPVHQDDTPDTLAARVLEVEHRIYPHALQLFAQNRIRLEGRRVLILDEPCASMPPETR
jgi:phosphoribosylglycinamide formyltransferase 1